MWPSMPEATKKLELLFSYAFVVLVDKLDCTNVSIWSIKVGKIWQEHDKDNGLPKAQGRETSSTENEKWSQQFDFLNMVHVRLKPEC